MKPVNSRNVFNMAFAWYGQICSFFNIMKIERCCKSKAVIQNADTEKRICLGKAAHSARPVKGDIHFSPPYGTRERRYG